MVSLNNVLRRVALVIGVLAVVALQGCASISANTTSEGGDAALMLKGHDPVAYFTENRPVPGNPAIKAQHAGLTYRFASAVNRDTFMKDPVRYVPQFNGYCSNGLVYAIPLGGNHDTFRVIDGKLYMFGGEGSRRYFEMDLERNRTLAHGYWESEVKDASPFWQSWKRRIFRVAHYKTNSELAAEYEARRKKQ